MLKMCTTVFTELSAIHFPIWKMSLKYGIPEIWVVIGFIIFFQEFWRQEGFRLSLEEWKKRYMKGFSQKYKLSNLEIVVIIQNTQIWRGESLNILNFTGDFDAKKNSVSWEGLKEATCQKIFTWINILQCRIHFSIWKVTL